MSRKRNKKQVQANNSSRVPSIRRTHAAFDSTFQPAMTTARRDIYKIGGYKELLTFDDHYTVFSRTFGGAGIRLLPNKAFSLGFIIKDGDSDGMTTQFEKDCLRLKDEFDFELLMRELVISSRVFQYAGIIITAKERDGDSKTMADEIGLLNGIDSIVKFNVVMQDQLSSENSDLIQDFSLADYGMPAYYKYDENVTSNQENRNVNSFDIHRSRVFTFSETAPPNKLEGTPFNEMGYNYIQNCEKVAAAAPEGFIKNVRGMTIFNIKDENLARAMQDPSGDARAKWNEADEDFHRGINTSRVVGGTEVNQHQINLADPTGTFMANFNAYAMTINTSGSILLGKQEGERASTEDIKKFIDDAKAAQKSCYAPMIRRCLKWLISMNAISKPSDVIYIEWPDLAEPSTADKLAKLEQAQRIDKLAFDMRQESPFKDGNEKRELSGLEAIEGESDIDFGEDDDLSDLMD